MRDLKTRKQLSEIPDFELLDIALENDVNIDGVFDRAGLEAAIERHIEQRLDQVFRGLWKDETEMFQIVQDRALRFLAELQGPQRNIELAHARADNALCWVLNRLGFERIVAEWQKVDKFYG
jgi:hypothetical protein